MRGFLLLSVVGALLYGLLLLISDVPDRRVEHSPSGHTERSADRTLRSWGSNLPALVREQPSNDRPSPAVGDDLFDVSQEKLAAGTAGGALQAQPETAQTAMGLRNEDELSKPTPTNPVVPRSKQRSRSAKSGSQVSAKLVAASELKRGRWARRGEPGRRLGLFGRRFARFDTSW